MKTSARRMFVLIFCSCLVAFLLFLFMTGGGIRTTKKTMFSNMYSTEELYDIEFKNVFLKRTFRSGSGIEGNIRVRLLKPAKSAIIVKINPKLSEDDKVITVIPTFWSRIFSSKSYDVKKIIIWVKNEKVKDKCKECIKKWTKKAERHYFGPKEPPRKKVPV